MILVIDVGNTNIVLGLYDGDVIAHRWRLRTSRQRTADEYGIMVAQLFAEANICKDCVEGAIIACVVPPVLHILVKMTEHRFGVTPLVVGPELKTGVEVLSDNPREVGADRIVNAVAAFARTQRATIVVDFGTATTFDVINADGAYLGGVISPGIGISAEALFLRASKLHRVEIAIPDRVIGRDTESSMQSGLVYGYLGLVEGIVTRICEEYGAPMHVIATGGLGGLFHELSPEVHAYDADLTLTGLHLLYVSNTLAGA